LEPWAASTRRTIWADRAGSLGEAGRRPVVCAGTVLVGIGDTDVFDFGGIISAIIGTVIVILIAGFFLRRRGTSRL
jgi:hypothetical protein